MGANGSGKSTLGMALAGHPAYRVGSGQALLGGNGPARRLERARARLFVSFQAPPDVPGVQNNLFIAPRSTPSAQIPRQPPQDAFDFLADAAKPPNAWGLPRPAGPPGQRRLSGGERKRK